MHIFCKLFKNFTKSSIEDGSDNEEDADSDSGRDDMEDFLEEDEGEGRYGFSEQEVLSEDEDEGDGQKNNVSGEETGAAIGGEGKSDTFKDGGTKTETESTNDGGADGEFWLSNDDLTEYMVTGKTLHTRHKKEAMLQDGKNPILTSDNEIKKFISDVIHGRAPGEVRAFGRVPKKLSDAVAKLRQTLNIDGRFLEIQSDAIRESYKRHSTPKMKGDIALSEADFENLHHYIYNFDGVLSVNDYHGKTEIHIYKKTDKGYYQIITVCSSERNSLQVTKIIGVSQAKFEEKYAKK